MILKSMIKAFLARLGLETAGYRAAARFRDPFDVQKSLLRADPPGTILDVGAHHGETAREYAARFPGALIHCFEPFPESFERVSALASSRDNIVAHRLAVAGTAGRRPLNVSGMPATNSLLPRSPGLRRYDPRTSGTLGAIEVDCVTLDGFCAENGIGAVDILKMDIQGAELEALRGAEDLLAAGRIGLIFTEVMFVHHYEGDPLFHDLAGFLAGRGYSLFDVFLAKHGRNGQLCFGDAIFVGGSLRSRVIDAFAPEP